MGGNQQCRPHFIQFVEQAYQPNALIRVNIAGRLIGNNNLRAGNDRTGNGRALLLAARQCGGMRLELMTQPDSNSIALARYWHHTGNTQGQGHIVINR